MLLAQGAWASHQEILVRISQEILRTSYLYNVGALLPNKVQGGSNVQTLSPDPFNRGGKTARQPWQRIRERND